MTDDPPRPTASRRRLLGLAAGVGIAASAGCLGSALESEPEEIEPREPTDPPEGTAGEFYYALEEQDEFDIEVDDLYWADSELGDTNDLILEYRSDADPLEDDESATDDDADTEDEDALEEGVDESEMPEPEEEIGLIMNVYNEILVEHGETDAHMLIGEVQNPFDGQAYGWGVKTEWLEAYNAGEMNEFALWMNVSNSRVYDDDEAEGDFEGDLEDGEFGDDPDDGEFGDDDTET